MLQLEALTGWPLFIPQLVISCASDVMVRPTMQALDVSGLTAIDILHVSFDMAQATWGVREWRQWSHGGPHFHWQFDTPVSLLIIEGVALIRPIGRWAHYRYQVLQRGDLAVVPAGFEADWTVHPHITMVWRRGTIDLARRVEEGAAPAGGSAAASSGQSATTGPLAAGLPLDGFPCAWCCCPPPSCPLGGGPLRLGCCLGIWILLAQLDNR